MEINKRMVRTLAILIAGGVLLNWLLDNFSVIGTIISTIWGLTFPFILGFVFAFLLNLPMSAIEKHVFRGRGGKLKRPFSFLISLVLVIGVVTFVIFMVIPELWYTLVRLALSMPGYVENAQAAIEPYLQRLPELESWIGALNIDWGSIINQVWNVLQGGLTNIVGNALNFATGLASGFVNVFIGIVFCCYLLFDKEHLNAQLQGLLRAYFPAKTYRRMTYVGRLFSKTYSGFVAGQLTEALIVTLLYTVTLSIGGFEYWLLISVLIGFCSIIPMIGAFVGCIIATILLLFSMGFWWAFAFVILFFTVQNFEGNVIYPRVVGSSVGLQPVWILVAVMMGGSLAGILGMLVFIPLFSVLYHLISRSARARLVQKGIASPTAKWRIAEGITKKHSKHAKQHAVRRAKAAKQTQADSAKGTDDKKTTADAKSTDATQPKAPPTGGAPTQEPPPKEM